MANIVNIDFTENATDIKSVRVQLRAASFSEVQHALGVAFADIGEATSIERNAAISALVESIQVDGEDKALGDIEYVAAQTILNSVTAFLAIPPSLKRPKPTPSPSGS